MTSQISRTLFDKLWDAHVVEEGDEERPALLYIDLHLIHEVTSHFAFRQLALKKMTVRHPQRTIAVHDHAVPTAPRLPDGQWAFADQAVKLQVEALSKHCERYGIPLLGLDSAHRGIVHAIGPELGLTQPGMTIACGDSHTSTHGALGALALGIGSTEVGHVLATQCLLQRKPLNHRVVADGHLGIGTCAKDLALAMIRKVEECGFRSGALEFQGSAVESLSMEGRLTLCNMAVEAGARTGLIAPDQKTMDYVSAARQRSPWLVGEWEPATMPTSWQQLRSDAEASFVSTLHLDAARVAPMVTYGTRPGMCMAVDEKIPHFPAQSAGARSLAYMGLRAGDALEDQKIDVVFVGSCTNGRLEDLRAAAGILKGQKVHDGVRMLVVPASENIRRDAEQEGLAAIFREAGAEWRIPGCSMCVAMNGDMLRPGELAVSTSNRNYEGRQGAGGRTILASPMTAAASAIAGRICDPRSYL